MAENEFISFLKGTQDPKKQIKQLFYVVVFLGILNIVLGFCVFFVEEMQTILEQEMAPFFFGAGIVILALGYWMKKKYSMAALSILCILYGVDTILTVYFSIENPPTGRSFSSEILMRVLILFYLFKGFSALKRVTKNPG